LRRTHFAQLREEMANLAFRVQVLIAFDDLPEVLLRDRLALRVQALPLRIS
jgi:hypothetical protein